MGLKIEGGQALARDLNLLSDRVRGRVLREAVRLAAEPMRRTMETLAPREPGAPDIAANIVISRIRKGGAVEDADAPEYKTESEEAVAVGPAKGFYYGRFLEYGTVKMAAQPFMRPAFDQEAPGAIPILADALGRALIEQGVRGSRGSSTGGGTL